jgi:hypothetical protein
VADVPSGLSLTPPREEEEEEQEEEEEKIVSRETAVGELRPGANS